MDNKRKKELAREYAERKQVAGVFAVRCGDAAWVGTSRNLTSAKTGLWFQLRQNGYINKAMQALWNAHGEAGFVFDVLEEITDDNPEMIALLLKEREAAWRGELNARGLAG